MDDLDDMYDDHPSLDASLEDFESNTNNHRRSPLFELPSQHSGFRSESEEGEMERESNERWSPPGFRPHDYVPNSGWYRHQPYVRRDDHGDARSRRSSPALSPEHNALVAGAGDVGDLTDVTIAANVPLPLGTDSPLKGRSPSPDPVPKVESIKGEGNEEEQDNEAAEPGKLSNCESGNLASLERKITEPYSRHPFCVKCRGAASRAVLCPFTVPTLKSR